MRDAPDKSYALECLRLAADRDLTPAEVVATAERYFEFVSGSQSMRVGITAPTGFAESLAAEITRASHGLARDAN